MITRRICVLVLAGIVVATSMNCQPNTYTVFIIEISQPERGPDSQIPISGPRVVTSSGAPLLVQFGASGFECPNQDMSFLISYVYRRVRPTNFLEDPSLYVMEGHKITTTVVSETCTASWTSPTLRDGIHTIGILAFDGSGAQSSWLYITIVKNNLRGDVSYFPGGDQEHGSESEEPPIDDEPRVIIDTPSHSLKIGGDPLQYVDIHFHTAYPFPIEYFHVSWTFTSASGCEYSSFAIVYPSGFNEGMYRLDMSTVFASEWDERPSDEYGKCEFGRGEFVITIYCKTPDRLGEPSSVTIELL
jgi:hypothetical protein